MKCKINPKGKPCRVYEILKREITDQDCIYCIAVNISGIARQLALIISEIGAQRHSEHFLNLFLELDAQHAALIKLTKTNYPKIAKQMKTYKPPVMLTPQDLPSEIRKQIEKYVKRGDQYRV